MHTKSPTSSRTQAIILSSLLLLGAGCTSQPEWQTETQPVHGMLTINGKPAKGAVVTLHPKGEDIDIRESKPWGVTDENGTYRLRTYTKDDGAPVGEYQATF
ncbi:MAG: hypothetical protein WEE51_10425, partial [Pirellulaceae bacterium]